ncbi:MAG: MBL fold metallo-hydrolase [Pirellulaceae bacterium]
MFARILILIVACLLPRISGAQDDPYVIVLGIAQDAGYPQASCDRDCCRPAWEDATLRRSPSCLALVDPVSGQRWLFECTPQFPDQLQSLDRAFPVEASPGLDGIFLTHAHIGHYAGLIHLGREVLGAREVPVHVMPRMRQFLTVNGPWSQLVELENIRLMPLEADVAVQLNERITVTPIAVPHRDEFSETVAFRITGPNRSVLFLPDIDKWERWERRVEEVLQTVDIAYLDATFFDDNELPGRNMAEIPHPFVVESLQRFGSLEAEQRARIRFIHLNHTNPALSVDSRARDEIVRGGMLVAEEGERVGL